MTFPVVFGAPVLLWGLLALPLAIGAYVVAQRRRARYAVRFTNLDLLANLVPHTPSWRRHVPAALYLLSLAALLVSLARPHAVIPVPRERATVVMVMDTSGSMAATDVQPNRMVAARQAGKTFLDVLPPQFRVSVVSFSSTAQTIVLPTTDRPAVREALDALYAEGGTAMGDAIQGAVEVAQTVQAPPPDRDDAAGPFPPARPGMAPGGGVAPGAATPGAATPGATVPGTVTPGAPAGAATTGDDRLPLSAILLLSDGANTTGQVEPLAAARAAQQLGIPVYTIALGTYNGVVDVPGPMNSVRRIHVPPDEVTLQQIADITGGQFFSAPTARDLRAVYQDIGSRIGFVHEEQEITFAFAAAAAVLLVAGGAFALHWFHRFP